MSDMTPETPDSAILDPEHQAATPDPTLPGASSAESADAPPAEPAAPGSGTSSPPAAGEPDPTVAGSESTRASSAPAPAPAEPGPAIESAVSGEVHKFRLVHEIYDATELVLHSARTSAPIALKDATEILALLAKFGL